MKQKQNKLNSDNFNLKNEIFSFLKALDIVEFFSVCKSFKFAVEKIEWFDIIKEDFEGYKSEAS